MQANPLCPAILVEGQDPQAMEQDVQGPSEEEIALMDSIKYNNFNDFQALISNLPEEFDINNQINGTTPLCLIASLGQHNHCQLLLSNKQVDLDQANAQGETPILLAIKNSHWDLAKFLLNMGANTNKPEPSGTIATPLFNAVWRGKSDAVRQLVKHGANVNTGSCRSAPIFMAARLGCLEITKVLYHICILIKRV